MNLSILDVLYVCCILITNLYGDSIRSLISPFQQQFIKYDGTRYVILFALFFVSTKQFLLSISATFTSIVVLKYITNETSTFCLIPYGRILSVWGPFYRSIMSFHFPKL